jgi:F420H(2)-dependent quinone reductase
MPTSAGPAVERVQPPKAPFRVVNRVMRWLLVSPSRSRRVGRHVLLLHLTGRRSGRRFVLPVGYRETGDGRLLLLTNSRWRANLRGGDTNVTVTILGRDRPARARLVEDPDTVAAVYRELIEQTGYANAGRRMGIRINVPRMPTLAELADAARRDGFAAVYLQLGDGR